MKCITPSVIERIFKAILTPYLRDMKVVLGQTPEILDVNTVAILAESMTPAEEPEINPPIFFTTTVATTIYCERSNTTETLAKTILYALSTLRTTSMQDESQTIALNDGYPENPLPILFVHYDTIESASTYEDNQTITTIRIAVTTGTLTQDAE